MADYRKDCTHPDHVHGPIGYTGWFEWAERKRADGYVQRRCPGCRRFAKWVKQDKRVPNQGPS